MAFRLQEAGFCILLSSCGLWRLGRLVSYLWWGGAGGGGVGFFGGFGFLAFFGGFGFL